MTVNHDPAVEHLRGLEGPDWRWKYARQLVGQPLPHRFPGADAWVHVAHDYLQLRAGNPDDPEAGAWEFPQLAAAEKLHRASALADQLKVLVVGNCTIAESAARVGVDARVVEVWERLFFDVRPVRAAGSWVRAWVIVPEEQGGNAALASKLKCAYGGGPVAATAVLEAESRVASTKEERVSQEKVLMHLKFLEAVAAPLATDRQKLQFVKLELECLHREDRLRLEERQLEQRHQEALRRQTLEDRRQEAVVRREQDEAARAAQHAAARTYKEDQRRRREAAVRSRAVAQAHRQAAAQARAAQSLLAQLRWAQPGAAVAESGPLASASAAWQAGSFGVTAAGSLFSDGHPGWTESTGGTVASAALSTGSAVTTSSSGTAPLDVPGIGGGALVGASVGVGESGTVSWTGGLGDIALQGGAAAALLAPYPDRGSQALGPGSARSSPSGGCVLDPGTQEVAGLQLVQIDMAEGSAVRAAEAGPQPGAASPRSHGGPKTRRTSRAGTPAAA